MTIGFDRDLYVLPFDHRGSFETKMFGWEGPLSPEQTAQIAAAKQVIYDGFTEGSRAERHLRRLGKVASLEEGR